MTAWIVLRSPDKVAAEDEAEDEDKDARPEDNHVDVEGQVLEGDGRHCARLVGVNQSQTTEAPWTKTVAMLKNRKGTSQDGVEALHRESTQAHFSSVGRRAISIVASQWAPYKDMETQTK